VEEGRLRTTPETLRGRFASERPLRIAIEAGTHSPWVSRVLEGCGHEVLVANARKLKLIYANKPKTDEVDAENLARVARLDPKLLYPLKHRSEDSQAHMAIIRSRQALVGCRTQLVNPGFGERSSPSEEGCPSALREVFARTLSRTSQRRFGRPSGPSWSRDRLADTVHPGLRPKASDDLQEVLSRNRSLAPGRGDWAAYSPDLRAHRGRSLTLRKEPQPRARCE
jgi:transposase